MKICELCKFPANTYCESDQASLCWDCDAKVHGANFLVARHVRCLLCQTCQSPTLWRADGVKLGRTISVCESCVGGRNKASNEDDENLTDEEEEEDGDNQVVPWSSESNTPPPSSSSSSSSENSGGDREISLLSLNRTRKNASDLQTQDLLYLMPSGAALANRWSQEDEDAAKDRKPSVRVKKIE